MKLIGTIFASLFVLATIACAPKATREDCTAACKHLTEMQMAAAGDAAGKIEAEFTAKIGELQKQQADALAALDKELEAKLAKAKKPADKDKVNKEFAAKKEAAGKPFAEQLKALEQSKAQAVTAAQDAQKKAMEQAITGCADSCVAAGLTKSLTDCQAAAANAEAYAQCK